MRQVNTLLLGILLLAVSGMSFADTVIAQFTPSAGWQSWKQSELTGSPVKSRPYWDNVSPNGTYSSNVGGCLANSANCGVANAPGAINYFGTNLGGAVSDFYFHRSGPAETLEAEISAVKIAGTFGWYDINDPGTYQILFSGKVNPGAVVDFAPSSSYGFFFADSSDPGSYFLTQASVQSSETGMQHLALFQQNASTYYFGAEDLSCHDEYNDMIVKISTVDTPECCTLALLGGGLFGFGLLGMRRRKTAGRS